MQATNNVSSVIHDTRHEPRTQATRPHVRRNCRWHRRATTRQHRPLAYTGPPTPDVHNSHSHAAGEDMTRARAPVPLPLGAATVGVAAIVHTTDVGRYVFSASAIAAAVWAAGRGRARSCNFCANRSNQRRQKHGIRERIHFQATFHILSRLFTQQSTTGDPTRARTPHRDACAPVRTMHHRTAKARAGRRTVDTGVPSSVKSTSGSRSLQCKAKPIQ